MSSVAVNPPKTPVTKGSNGIATATLPNVCKMPGPPAPFVPTPLPNIGKSGDSPQGYSTTVKIEGQPVGIQGASFGSMGDVASKGTGGGIVSNNVEGPTKFLAPGSLNVKIEGKNVQYLGDQMLNNCGPGGSPANSATLEGVVQPPQPPVFTGNLDALADECNKKTNAANGHCPGGPPNSACTALGTAKHKCCENAIKEYNKIHPNSPYESEVGFDALGNKVGSAAFKGPIKFEADVLISVGQSGYSDAFEFKFNCKPVGTTGLISKRQYQNYLSAVKRVPRQIHKDGRSC